MSVWGESRAARFECGTKVHARLLDRKPDETGRGRSAQAKNVSVPNFAKNVIQRPGGLPVGCGFLFAQDAEVFVFLDFRLHLQELLIGEHDEFLAAVFLDDLWVDAHGGFSGRIPSDGGYDKQ